MKTENLTRSLAAHPFVKQLPERYAAFLATCIRNERVKKGEFLFREGSEARRLYLLRSGKLRLEVESPGRGVVGFETLEEGEVIGWRILFGDSQWHLDCRCLESALLFSVEARCLQDKMQADTEFAYTFTKALLQQAHLRLQRARLHQLDVYR